MPSTSLAFREPLDPAVLRPLARQLVVLANVLALVGLATLLPGAERTVPGTFATVRALVVALGSLAAVAVLLRAARSAAALVRGALEGPDGLVDDAARVAGALVIFAAVLVAYHGLAGVVVPRLAVGDAAWAYDAGFLALALWPLGVVARRSWRHRERLADQLAAAVADRVPAGDGRTEA